MFVVKIEDKFKNNTNEEQSMLTLLCTRAVRKIYIRSNLLWNSRYGDTFESMFGRVIVEMLHASTKRTNAGMTSKEVLRITDEDGNKENPW